MWVRKTVAHSESPVVTHKPAVHAAGERCHRADGGETRWPADTRGAVNIWVQTCSAWQNTNIPFCSFMQGSLCMFSNFSMT